MTALTMKQRYKILEVAQWYLGKNDYNMNPEHRFYNAGSEWCSEFVSVVYRDAGVPFTDGSFSKTVKDILTESGELEGEGNGEWMLRSSSRIINYFKENGRYIDRENEEWWTYIPKVGDYVFIGRAGSDRSHSGIVWYTHPEGTLLTIEGNNAGRPVAIYSYPRYLTNYVYNWHANGIIEGIGVR